MSVGEPNGSLARKIQDKWHQVDDITRLRWTLTESPEYIWYQIASDPDQSVSLLARVAAPTGGIPREFAQAFGITTSQAEHIHQIYGYNRRSGTTK